MRESQLLKTNQSQQSIVPYKATHDQSTPSPKKTSSWRVAEVFGRVFVLTRILRGVIKYERRSREPLRGSGGMSPQNILKSGGPEMLISALRTSIFETRWSIK